MTKIKEKLTALLGQSDDCPKRKLYSIEINTYKSPKRYIAFCDKHWYETTDNSLPVFTQEEVDKIVSQMKKHFITPNKLTIKTLDGEQYIPQEAMLKPHREAKKPLYFTTHEERKKLRDEVKDKYAAGFSFSLSTDKCKTH